VQRFRQHHTVEDFGTAASGRPRKFGFARGEAAYRPLPNLAYDGASRSAASGILPTSRSIGNGPGAASVASIRPMRHTSSPSITWSTAGHT